MDEGVAVPGSVESAVAGVHSALLFDEDASPEPLTTDVGATDEKTQKKKEGKNQNGKTKGSKEGGKKGKQDAKKGKAKGRAKGKKLRIEPAAEGGVNGTLEPVMEGNISQEQRGAEPTGEVKSRKKGGKTKTWVEAPQGLLFVDASAAESVPDQTLSSDDFFGMDDTHGDVHLGLMPMQAKVEAIPLVSQPSLQEPESPLHKKGTSSAPAPRKKPERLPHDWKTNPPLIRASAKFDPKVFWGNERTLLSWLGLATFQSMAAIQLLSFEELAPQIGGAVMAFVSIFVAIYALLRWHTRNLALRRGGKMTIVTDMIGPWIFIPIVCMMLISLTTFTFLYGLKKNG